MYEIPVTANIRYRKDVRRSLEEIGLPYTEDKGFLTSRFVIQTSCVEMYAILTDFIAEPPRR